MDVATPSVKTGFTKDIYLTIENGSKPSTGAAKLKIFIKPMIVWLWVGGMLCAVGTVLAAVPRPATAASPPTRCRRLVPLDDPDHTTCHDACSMTRCRPPKGSRSMSDPRRLVAGRRSSRSPWRRCWGVVLGARQQRSGPDRQERCHREPAARPARRRRCAAPPSTSQPFDLARRKGSWVVLNFFNSTCAPCKAEHPELVEFTEQQAIVR